MNVALGINLAGLLFEPDSSIIESELHQEVTTLLATYEPGVHVVSIRPIVGETGYGISTLEVDYIRVSSTTTPARISQDLNTALINVGGSVSEVIRG